MKQSTSYQQSSQLIVLSATVVGPSGPTEAKLVLDTGAVMTTLTPDFAERIGYSARDGERRTYVRSATAREEGYELHVAALKVMNLHVSNMPVNVFDLGFDDFDGLLGLNFLNALNYEIRSADKTILAEPIAAPPSRRAKPTEPPPLPERLTWQQIRELHPDHHVYMIDVEYAPASTAIISARLVGHGETHREALERAVPWEYFHELRYCYTGTPKSFLRRLGISVPSN